MKQSDLTRFLLLMLLPMSASASLDKELDQMFDGMTNLTQPTAQMGQRRGVLSGGSLALRNRIIQGQPITLSPPSFSGGCGGIDLYGGSFSFINDAQFMTLLRSIAANAGGYAFQLGINAMCPDCGSLMSDLQKKLQTLNQHFANSCQLAQGLVNDGLSAIDSQNRSRMSQISLARGVGDVFQTFTSHGGDTVQTARHSDPDTFKSQITGNLMWRALHQGHTDTWFANGDSDLLEALMSVTGSIIVKVPESQGSPSSPMIERLPPLIGIREFINGSDNVATGDALVARGYRCDTQDADGCLNPRVVSLTLRGFRARIEKILGGDEPGTGIVDKFSTGQGEFSADELGFMALAPKAIGALIRNLAREDPALARHFIEEATPILAVELAGEVVEAMAKAGRESASVGGHAYQSLLAELLDQSLSDIRHEREQLHLRFGSVEGLTRHYESLIRTGKPRHYGIDEGLAGGSRQGLLK